ncbi:MAG: GTP-binding protein [Deltaproteobacteria bacterium]|nr:GTP-binding protein [Deltaproteobacteria bacterium]
MQALPLINEPDADEPRADEHEDAMDAHKGLKIVIVGHVDHGKSTLIGRLFFDTGSLPAERYEEIVATCKRQGREFEFAYLMDALEEEREQNITIETAQTFFKTDKRPYVIIDAPGHKEFLKNMITGSAAADAAILLVDANEGMQEQTRRHAYVLSLLGIRQIIVAVNKLDRAGFSRKLFNAVSGEVTRFLHSVGLVASYIVPISAKDGDNIVNRSARTPWFHGPTFVQALDAFESVRSEDGVPLRLPIQDIYKWDNKRIYAGRIESGQLRVGDRIIVAPTGKTTTVKGFVTWNDPDKTRARAGESVGITLTDELFAERGHVIASTERPPTPTHEITASLFWLGREPLKRGQKLSLRLATADVEAELTAVTERIDSSTLAVLEKDAAEIHNTETANVRLRMKKPIAADPFDENVRLGRFVIATGDRVAGGGIVRTVVNALLGTAHRVIRLSDAVTSWPEPNLIDLRSEQAQIEFDADPAFLEALRQGDAYLFRFVSLDHLPPISRLAYEHDLVYTFRRDGQSLSVVLQAKKTAEKIARRRPGIRDLGSPPVLPSRHIKAHHKAVENACGRAKSQAIRYIERSSWDVTGDACVSGLSI